MLLLLSPRSAIGYAGATLSYTFALGPCTATLTAMVLEVIGEGATATRMSVFFAMNAMFGLAMSRLDGAAHDRWAANGMLLVEAGVGAACLLLFAVLASRIRGTEPPPAIGDVASVRRA